MNRYILILMNIVFFFHVACKNQRFENYDVRVDFRFGKKFISFKINESGNAYAIKGHGNNYTEKFEVVDSVISKPFLVDSVKKFYKILDKIKQKTNRLPNVTDGMRTEIYHNGTKVYDTYSGNEDYWYLFDLIINDIPNGYNPFRSNEFLN